MQATIQALVALVGLLLYQSLQNTHLSHPSSTKKRPEGCPPEHKGADTGIAKCACFLFLFLFLFLSHQHWWLSQRHSGVYWWLSSPFAATIRGVRPPSVS
jgi:hypothetical protein